MNNPLLSKILLYGPFRRPVMRFMVDNWKKGSEKMKKAKNDIKTEGQCDKQRVKRYGETEQEKRIIELGEKGKLTIGDIFEIYGKDKEQKADHEFYILNNFGLIKIDEKDNDEKGFFNANTKLIWTHKKGDKIPFDPDLMYKREKKFEWNFSDDTCQRCGKKYNPINCINLNCQPRFDDKNRVVIGWEELQWWNMVALCGTCHSKLIHWLRIPERKSVKKPKNSLI